MAIDRYWLNVLCRAYVALNMLALMTTSGRRVLADDGVDFQRDIQPMLASRCYRCHGPDDEARQAGLRLDLASAAYGQLDSGLRAVVPGDVEGSELWQRINQADPDLRMPPIDSGEMLSESERSRLRAWLEQGAEYASHWAFVPPRAQQLPDVGDRARQCLSPIDRWVAEGWRRQGLTPNPRAERMTLIRRVSLDLIGLPPTPDEIDRFLADGRPDAYERLVDRLLASPAFGERWARPWLDLARFADSAGYAQDPPREIWRYRDWVIGAFNQNLPFDQFTIEQLAGDLLPNPTNDQLLATAFHRNTMTNSEGGTDNEEFRVAAVVDRVNTTMQVWMGITMGCAQCHTHKYDPITQTEYFQVLSIFNNTADMDREDEFPWLVEHTDDERQKIAALEREISQLQAELDDSAGTHGDTGARGSTTASDGAQESGTADIDARKALDERLQELRKQRDAITGIRTPILQELPSTEQRETYVHVRGNFLIHGERVSPGVPQAFPPLPAGEPVNRLTLARWLVDPANPLTARVAVNRLWEQLFGVGLVETSEDFGLQGDLPSHPELLDMLAVELIGSGWDLKHLLRAIVTSATYCQSSVATDDHLTRDPANRWLARGATHRVPAEMLRDQALAVGGILSRKVGGPSVRPHRPQLGLRSAFGGSTDWESSPGEDRYRRGLYTSWRRTTPYPSFTTFDAPSREVCTIRRIATNTPLQALASLNDPVFVEAAQGLARRLMAHPGTTHERCDLGMRLCTARHATEDERVVLSALYSASLAQYQQSPEMAAELAEDPLGPAPAAMNRAELAAWTVVANVLLNLDEVLAKK
jgi:hypothetical protein